MTKEFYFQMMLCLISFLPTSAKQDNNHMYYQFIQYIKYHMHQIYYDPYHKYSHIWALSQLLSYMVPVELPQQHIGYTSPLSKRLQVF